MKRVFFVTLSLLILLLVSLEIGCRVLPNEGVIVEDDYSVFEASWSQINADGSRTPVNIPGRVTNESGQWVEVACIIPELPDSRHSLLLRSSQQDMQIIIDGELRKEYTTENTRLFGKSSMSSNVFVQLEKEDSGRELIVRTKSVTSYSGFYNVIYYGNDVDLLGWLIEKNFAGLVVAYTLFFSGLLTFAIGIVLRARYRKSFPMIYAALEAVIASLQAILESRLRQFYLPNVSLAGFLSYFLIGLIPVVTILYINTIQKNRYLKVYKPLTIICLISGLVNVLLQIFDIQDMYRSLGRSYFLFAVSFVVIMYTFYKDYKLGILKSIRYPVIGVVLTFIAAFGEIIITLLKYVTITGLFLNIGMASMLIAAIMESFKQVDEVNNERLKAISDSKAKQAFLANMSHEIRTPINAILGMNEMILRETGEEQIGQYSSNIKIAGDNLLDIINDILDFSKIELGKLEIVEEEYSLSTLVRDVKNIISVRAASKDLEFEIELGENLPDKLIGDEYRVRQIMLNLLNNAVKYTERGNVVLKLDGGVSDQNTTGYRLNITVTDTGIGIKKEDITRIFDSFERLDSNNIKKIEGTGLGLAITRTIVDMMEGNISVESEYGQGSTFSVDIIQRVVSDEQFDHAVLDNNAGRKHEEYKEIFRAPNSKILVVDDYPINLTVIHGLLKKTQVQIADAKCGEECIEMCRKERFDLILMDHMMPGMDGVEVFNILKEEHENLCPVIVLTANAIKGAREQYLDMGFADYISKPVNPTELELMLKKYLKG